MSWLTTISTFFSAIGAYFGWAKLKEEEKNTVEMRENEKSQDRQEQVNRIQDQIEKAGEGNKAAQEELRNAWSEN